MQLDRDQVAVVTGAASGIGLALCRALAARGLRLVMADVEAPALDDARAALEAAGASVLAMACDVSDAEAMERLASAAEARFGPVDLLVNNAGVGGVLCPIWDAHPDDWTWLLRVNVIGVANGLRAFVPGMMARNAGHILNVASLAAVETPPFLGPYAASKHAVLGLSESLRAELRALGSAVRVSVLCPGMVQSRIAESARNRPADLGRTTRTDPALLARLRAVFDELMAAPMPADDLAERALAALEADAFLILTHPAAAPAAA